jgi:biofilm PGA synthesis N-glycosyltransferase PgaC
MEAFKAHGSLLFRRRLSTFLIWWNLLFPYMDLVYTIAVLPAVLLACMGIYGLAAAMLAFVLPAALLAHGVIYAVQARMFRDLGLTVRRNPFGLLGYAVLYGLVLKPASVMGYLSGLLTRRSRDYSH